MYEKSPPPGAWMDISEEGPLTMKKTNLLAVTLALLLLAGCTTATSPTPTPNVDNTDLAFQAAGLRKDHPIATVDGATVTAGEYLFWLTNSIAMREYYGYLSTDAGWAAMTEEIKSDALDTAVLYEIIRAKVKEYGITLTAEETQQMEDELENAIEQLGGENAFLGELDMMCVDKEGYLALNEVSYLYRALQNKLVADGVVKVNPEDIDQFVEDYIESNGLYGAKHILISTRRTSADGNSYEDFSDAEKAAAYQMARDLRDQLAQAGDSEELFDQLMNEFSEDGRDPETGELYSPDGYKLVFAGQMVPEFEARALALEVGQIGDIVQTDYGYHIIMRIDLDMDLLGQFAAQTVNESYKMGLLSQEWVDQATVVTEAAYDTIDPKTFYETLSDLAQARAIARQLEANANK